jgi:hypothetical protein
MSGIPVQRIKLGERAGGCLENQGEAEPTNDEARDRSHVKADGSPAESTHGTDRTTPATLRQKKSPARRKKARGDVKSMKLGQRERERESNCNANAKNPLRHRHKNIHLHGCVCPVKHQYEEKASPQRAFMKVEGKRVE